MGNEASKNSAITSKRIAGNDYYYKYIYSQRAALVDDELNQPQPGKRRLALRTSRRPNFIPYE